MNCFNVSLQVILALQHFVALLAFERLLLGMGPFSVSLKLALVEEGRVARLALVLDHNRDGLDKAYIVIVVGVTLQLELGGERLLADEAKIRPDLLMDFFFMPFEITWQRESRVAFLTFIGLEVVVDFLKNKYSKYFKFSKK